MDVATLTSKGQITLPVRMREKLRLRPGSKLVFEEQPNGDFVVRRQSIDVRSLKGMLRAPPGVCASIEDMDDAIAAAVIERHERSRS
jgi:AbrB family looped-hinge helix DNA binding protein